VRRLPTDELELASSALDEGPKPGILVVEDDPAFARVLVTALAADGYKVFDANTGQRALEEVRTRNPDVVLLDLGLPDFDGLRLVSEVRKHTKGSIIVVSGHDHETNKVAALDAGANDYVTKPFSVSELRARVRVGLRARSQVGGSVASIVAFGDFKLDLAARRLMRGERQVRLSATEFKLLVALARHANEVVTTHTLLKEAWGSAYQTRAGYVRVYMHALRGKLEKDPARPQYLLNEIGLGYKLRTTSDR
jgi:two-component system, OmpR family, KDP operon response regulator KdpE